jgi:hypothetical protein
MSLSKDNETHQEVFRDEIKEGRENYYVEYQPADERYPFADLQLVFPQDGSDAEAISRLMENELERWLKRFPVPVMVTACDSKEDAIHIPSKNDESFLMGYINLQTGKLIQKWGLLKEKEMPAEQKDPKYLEQVYKGVPFQLQKDVRQKAQSELEKRRTTVLTARFIILFIFVIPVLIEIVGLGVAWLGYTLSGISITAGLYKLAKHIGWIKPSKRQQEKEKEERKKEHYFYHCELNPAGFNRLKVENFKRDATERTHKEAEMLKKAV